MSVKLWLREMELTLQPSIDIPSQNTAAFQRKQDIKGETAVDWKLILIALVSEVLVRGVARCLG